MQAYNHSLHNLFEQLGLASTNEAIENFVKKHAPLARDVLLSDAEFWTPSQAAFIQESKDDDADWAEVVDKLDAMLRDSY